MTPGFTEVFLPTPLFYATILFAVLYDLFWRGLALWKASKNDQKGWFVALLVISSVGILPLFYIFLFQKGKKGL
jgi:hypothetical protein